MKQILVCFLFLFMGTVLCNENNTVSIETILLHTIKDLKEMVNSVYNDKIINIEKNDENIILINQGLKYSQSIKLNNKLTTIYILVENKNPVFFNQYIEIHLFLE